MKEADSAAPREGQRSSPRWIEEWTALTCTAGKKLQNVANFIDTYAHWLYLSYALPMLLFLTFGTPPFQVPDENAHFLRAEQISHGRMVGFRLGDNQEWSGGLVDPAIETALAFYVPVIQHGDVRLSGKVDQQAREVGWNGRLQQIPFPNTVNYGPILYLPQAIAIRLAKRLDLRVVETMLFVRLLDALGATLLSLVGLKLCRHGRAMMFTTLLFPMTLFQYAAISQDVWIVSCSVLFIGIVSNLIDTGRSPQFLEYLLLVSILSAIAMVRPPGVFLACLLPLLPFAGQGKSEWRTEAIVRAAVAGVGSFLVVIWFWLVSTYSFVDLIPSSGISAAKQIKYLLDDPRRIVWIAYHTFAVMGSFEYKSVIGVLGWLDTYLPPYYYNMALIALAVSLGTDIGGRSLLTKRGSLLALAAILLFGASLFGIQYVSWSAVGAPGVAGYQGRYMLAFVPLLGWLLLGFRPKRSVEVFRLGWIVVAMFPLITLAQLPLTIIERYYLQP